MTPIKKHLARAAFAALLGAAALPALAASSAASSLSDSLSDSSKGISDAIKGSSNSSSPDNRQVRGEYKVIDMADAAGQPGQVQLHLQHVVALGTAEDDILLTLPRVAADRGHVATGAVITATQRPYGIEFEAGQPHAAFFLALADDWTSDLKSTPLTL
jgi:ABC-type Fe3+-hydroxamate transport system substrate-binding protein